MLNFYVVLAGHDKVSDAGWATTCNRKLKAPSLQTESTKMEGPSKITFTENPFDDFRQNKILFLA